MPIYRYIIISIIVLLLIIILISYICYLKAFYHSAKKNNKPFPLPCTEQYIAIKEKSEKLYNEIKNISYEKVSINSFDRKRLTGKYYHYSDNAPLQIQFHGYKGKSFRDFCGGHKIARESGFNILLIDHRAHGESDGNTITFGINEHLDCLKWIEYANKRFNNKPIILAGISMGASTVIMAAGQELPNNVVGVVADCPYTSPKDIICKVCKEMKISPRIAYPFIKLGASIFGHFNLTKTDCISAATNTKIPILIIHGEDDYFVPHYMGKKIANCSPLIQFESFPNAGHGLSYMVDTERYVTTINKFINKCLNKKSC